MPYKSLAQQRFFNANKPALEKQSVNVAEWNKATGDKKLPEKIGKSPAQKSQEKLARAMQGKKR